MNTQLNSAASSSSSPSSVSDFLVTPCCKVPAAVAGSNEGTHWHECPKCGFACDPVEPDVVPYDDENGEQERNGTMTDDLRALPASDSFGWFWSVTHKEWNLRRRHNAPSRATVWGNGIWHTWDHQGIGGENSSAATVEEAKAEAFFSAKRQGFLDKLSAQGQARVPEEKL